VKLTRLALENWRNIPHALIEPEDGLNVLCGENGQGKTNLLEAIWMLTGAKSFRAAKDAELIRRGADFAVLDGAAECGGRVQTIYLTVGSPGTPRPGRTARLNGVDKGRAASLAGTFTAVVFEPDHLGLIKGSPGGRRRFLDAALCQLYPGYLAALRRYSRVLAQKNALLKQYNRLPDAGDLLEVYDQQLAAFGQEVTGRRTAYLEALTPLAVENYRRISQGREELNLAYKATFEGSLLEAYRRLRPAELRAGFCLAGPHREDLEVLLDGQPARVYGSQGQQRSAVLALKLAEATQAEAVTGEHPVMLLDDVLSELDDARQNYLLTRMTGKQVFVTACDSAAFGRAEGRVYRLECGAVTQA